MVTKFEKAVELVKKELDLDLNYSRVEFGIYLNVIDVIKNYRLDKKPLYKDVESIIRTIDSVWMKDESGLDIYTIADAVVLNWEQIKAEDMDKWEILGAIGTDQFKTIHDFEEQ